jgi:predicted P-loop ATPase
MEARMSGAEEARTTIDYVEAEHYLETLIGPSWATTTLVAQTFDDNATRRKRSQQAEKAAGGYARDKFAKVHIGTWEKLKSILTTYNKNGAGVFLTINETVGGRQVKHLQGIRAVWCEWDSSNPPPEWPLTPHIEIESSPGKYHFYWLTASGALTANDHARIMSALVGKWGSDPNAEDVVRVLRIPGFLHQKVDENKGLKGIPWQVRLRRAEGQDVVPQYTFLKLIQGFGVEEWEAKQQYRTAQPPPSGRPGLVTPINIGEVKEALKHISADRRDVWLKIGMALASTRHTSAFQLWEEWSKTSPSYDEEDQYRVWQSFREQKNSETNGSHVTLGTLFKSAKEAGWDRESGWHKDLLTNIAGKPMACSSNIAMILRNTSLYKDHLRYNIFAGHVEYGDPVYDEFGRSLMGHRWSDNDDALLAEYLNREHKMLVTSLTHCSQAVEQIAKETEYDPVVAWLDGLPTWDGIDRLDSFFEDHCEVPKTPYSQFCGRSLFVSLVARAYFPGCQVDTVLVLQGEEGAKKTSLCRLLGGPWYKAITLSFESKDLYQSLRRTWLGELAELDSFARSGQARIKAILSTMEDSYRPPYGRHEIDQKRRSVFLGTTNDPAYIVDPHGARRFLPLEVGTINLESVADALLQLFAEASHRFKEGDTWWQESDEVKIEAIDKREIVREADPWESIIEQYATTHPGELFMTDIFGSLCLNIPSERQTRAQMTRAGVILHRLGYLRIRRREPGNAEKRQYVYVKK